MPLKGITEPHFIAQGSLSCFRPCKALERFTTLENICCYSSNISVVCYSTSNLPPLGNTGMPSLGTPLNGPLRHFNGRVPCACSVCRDVYCAYFRFNHEHVLDTFFGVRSEAQACVQFSLFCLATKRDAEKCPRDKKGTLSRPPLLARSCTGAPDGRESSRFV